MVQFLIASLVTSSILSSVLVQLLADKPMQSHRGSNYLLILLAGLIGLVAFFHLDGNILFSGSAIIISAMCMVNSALNIRRMVNKIEKKPLDTLWQMLLVTLLLCVTVVQFGQFSLDVVLMIHVFCWLLVLVMWLHIAVEVWLLAGQYAAMKASFKDHWLFNECSFESRISSIYILEWASIAVSLIALLHEPSSMVSLFIADGSDISYKTLMTIVFLLLFIVIKLLHYFNKIKVYSRNYFFIVSTLPLALIIAIGISAV